MSDTVTVTWGQETVSPFSFNTFVVGPFQMTTHIREGESPEQAMSRAYKALETFARVSYATKLATFRQHHAEAKGER